MRRLSERKDAYRLLLSSPHNQRLFQPAIHLRKVVLSHTLPDPPSQLVDAKVVDSIRSLELPTNAFDSFKWINREYHLCTPPVLDHVQPVIRKRDRTQQGGFRLNTGARHSQARFLESVRSIRQYDGAPSRGIQTLREQANYQPYNHPSTAKFFSLMREGKLLEMQRLAFLDRKLLAVQDPVGSTPLHLAVKRDDLRMVRMLIGLGAKVEAQDIVGRTPLYLAARKDHTALVSLLLLHGASPRSRTIKGHTPLQAAPKGSDTWTLLVRAAQHAVKQSGLVY